MIKGLYTSASGMLPHTRKQEAVANNLANASTPGYKKSDVFIRELSRAEARHQVKKSDWQQPMDIEQFTDYQQGSFDRTGNPLNLAIDGDGFFMIQLPNGERGLTRSGSFVVDANGLLAVPGGGVVLGDGGPIEVGNEKITVAATGEISAGNIQVGQIVPVTVADLTELPKVGGSLYLVPKDAQLIRLPQSTIQQGFLEASNVDTVREMIEMIISFRAYEANARAIESQDQSLSQLLSKVAGSQR